MDDSSFTITPINLSSATEHEYAALSTFINHMRSERLPDDPPIPNGDLIQRWQNIPPFVGVSVSAVWNLDHTAVIALGQVQVMRMEENQHLAQFSIEVLPEYRRHGLGKRLLAFITDKAVQENRRLLLTETNGRIPAGEAFMNRLGASKGLEGHINQLKISDVNRDMVTRWQARAPERANDFAIGFWDGAYPEEHIAEIAQLMEVMNQQPLGTLELEDMHYTPEQLRQIEQSIFSDGSQRWTCYAYESASGAFAGFTFVVWNPNRPDVMQQGDTGVWPRYRNRGLGRWLKATMLDKILNERPQVKFIRTGNADNNAAMLKINHELGFQPYMSNTLWQLETLQVQQYLGKA
jgi:mycothiol synthase